MTSADVIEVLSGISEVKRMNEDFKSEKTVMGKVWCRQTFSISIHNNLNSAIKICSIIHNEIKLKLTLSENRLLVKKTLCSLMNLPKSLSRVASASHPNDSSGTRPLCN